MKKEKKSKGGTEILNEEELAMLRASHEGETDRSTLPPHDNSDLAKAKRFAKKNKFSVAFVIITVVLLVAVIGVLCYMLYSIISSKPSSDDFTVTMGDEEYVIPYEDAMIDGVFYLDLRKIALYTDLIISGSEGRMKFSCEDGTYVRFEHGSTTATVNGTRVRLEGTAKIIDATKDTDGECLVPFSFIQKLFSLPTAQNTPGVRTRFSDKDNTVIIRRVTFESGKYLPISFSADQFQLAEEDQMLAYKALYPDIASACVKNTLLVNKNNPLGEGYTPEGLFSLNELGCPVVAGGEYELIGNAALSLTAMMADMEKALGAEDTVLVTSAYRSYSYQKSLFAMYVNDLIEKGYSKSQAEAIITRTAARQGESEHQSGLCVDLIERGKLELNESFENCAAFEWLSDNAHRYGFILRYPKDKVSVTGYDYEPWHYRFVGIDAATVIYEDGICLEEYLAKN